MKIFIPVVGDELRLTHDITTSVRFAGQNKRFVQKLVDSTKLTIDDDVEMTLRKNTVLKVERVYVRQGPGAEFDSVTFRIGKDNASQLPDGRFFLPIEVINTLDVELLQNGNHGKPETLREMVSRLYAEASIEDRMDDSCRDKAFKEFDTLPSALSGSIVVDLAQECHNVRKAVDTMLKDNGVDSVEALFAEAEKHINEDKFANFEMRFDAAQVTMHRIIDHVLANKYPLYHFTLKYRNGEALIGLASYGRAFLDALTTYINVAHALLNVLTEKYVRPVEALPNLLSFMGGKESFGRYCNKHNYNPKTAIKRRDGNAAILPQDAFTDNVFTRTKSDDHGYVFNYQLDDGRTLSIKEMRKEIRTLAKEHSA